jgi:hypothetical protein
VRAGVHANRTTERRGDLGCELEAGQSVARRESRAGGKLHGAAEDETVLRSFVVAEVAAEAHSDPTETIVGNEQIRSATDDRDGKIASQLGNRSKIVVTLRFDHHVGRASDAERREGRERRIDVDASADA